MVVTVQKTTTPEAAIPEEEKLEATTSDAAMRRKRSIDTPPKPGRLSQRGRAAWAGLGLALPALLLLSVMLVVIVIMARYSLSTSNPASGGEWDFSFASWKKLLSNDYIRDSFWLTLRLSVLCTVFVCLVDYVIAIAVRIAGSARLRNVVAIAMYAPLLSNVVLQTLGWIAVLSPSSPLSWALKFTYSSQESAVLIVMVHHALAYAYFAIDGAMQNASRNMEAASATLGASNWRTIRKVIFPLTLPGLIPGSLLVFALAFSNFVIPLLIGHGQISMLSVVAARSLDQGDWSMTSAIATGMTIVAVLVLVIYRRAVDKYSSANRNPVM